MDSVTEEYLDNTWKIRDICQEISSRLEDLTNEEISDVDKAHVNSDYEIVSSSIQELTSLGYFNKKSVSPNQITTIVNNILDIENKNANIVARLWEKQITPVNKFNQDNFKLCVRPCFNGLNISHADPYLSCLLISNKNIYMPCNEILGERNDRTISGYVYPVNQDNFIAATDASSNIIFKDEKDVALKDFLPVSKRDGKYLFLGGYANKLKSPNEIIRAYSNDRFTSNNNAVVLSGDTQPCAIFCTSHILSHITDDYMGVRAVAQAHGLPLLEISIEDYLMNNKKYFSSAHEARAVFNKYLDVVAKDLKDFCGHDVFVELRKLKGFNTNLRYNYFYKFINGLKKHFDSVEVENKKAFIVKSIKKSVEKRNMLQIEREKANGGTLVYPTETMYIPLPAEFVG